MEESDREWEKIMRHIGYDSDAARTLRLIRRVVHKWPAGPVRDQLKAAWYGRDHLQRALLITELQVPRAGLTPDTYASALLVAYIKKYCST